MKVFWNDSGRGIESDQAKSVSLEEAQFIWSDEVRGIEGNFMGLIDEDDNTIQFYFKEGIPDEVNDAHYLSIVDLDFPVPAQGGSYVAEITVGDVQDIIKQAFNKGANYKNFSGLNFESWG